VPAEEAARLQLDSGDVVASQSMIADDSPDDDTVVIYIETGPPETHATVASITTRASPK
jgi:hypothetical protein